MLGSRSFAIRSTWLLMGVIFCLIFSNRVYANAEPYQWQLYDFSQTQQFDPYHPLSFDALPKIDGISLTGGHYLYAGDLSIPADGDYVVDFKNTSAIDRFHIYLYDLNNQLIDTALGGIGSDEPNPFFLRHGRSFHLKAGQYKLLVEVSSPYFIAQPVPYVATLSHYQQSIKMGNAIVLIGLGIFLSMGIYYGALSFARSRNTEILYAIFIFSNLAFNAGAHQLLAQLFDVHNFYLISAPILVSNFIYVLFVMKLLGIKRASQKVLHTFGVIMLSLIAAFAAFAIVSPHWINEMARYGVWVFLLFGLVAGITRSVQGSMVARLYLLALFTFVGLASMATIPTNLNTNTIYVEHYGLAAIAMEIILLALVMTYQMALLYRERIQMLSSLDHNKKLALTDAVTGIPNLHALEIELATFEKNGCLTYIDMDNLKYYNDRYGHAKGDKLLQMFSTLMKEGMEDTGFIYRVGGDEFAVTCREDHRKKVQDLLDQVIEKMRLFGFKEAGVSAGVAMMYEVQTISDLKHLADTRMYEMKQQRKKTKVS